MKRTITLTLWICVLLLGVNLKGMAETTLSAGDIAIIRMNEDSPSDGFSFVTLVEITSGTIIYFTEEGWAGSSWNGNTESHLKYTATTTLNPGTVIHIDETSTADVFSIIGGGSLSFAWGTTGFNLSGGDQIIAYQTAETSKPLTPIFIAGLTMNDGNSVNEPNDSQTGWTSASAYTVSGVNVSRLPNGLTNGTHCISVFPDYNVLTEKDNARYNCILISGTKDDLLKAINNNNNWTYDDAINYPTSSVCSFSVISVVAPTATTDAANSLTSSGATMNGTVNANNAATSVTFEYGLTTAYGSSVTALESPVNGTSAVAVSYVLGGLAANTTYHYRVVATNSGGTTYGDDVTFATSEVTGMDYATNEPLVLYPNPTQDGFYVNAGEAACELTICNLSGQVVYRQSVSKGSFVAMASFASGVYLVKFNDKIKKLIKN